MKNRAIEVRRGNATVKVNKTKVIKSGVTYISYVVNDYTGGKRKQYPFASEREATAKAVEIAQAVAAGQTEVLKWEDGLRVEIRKSLEVVEPTGMTILPAVTLLAQAVGILGAPDELLAACTHWKQHRPNKPLTPKPVKDAVADYQKRRKLRISLKRHNTETTYFNHFVRKYGEKLIDGVDGTEIEDLLNEKKWMPKTRNDFRGGGVETASNSLVEIGQWTRKDSANLKWLSIADLGACGRLFAVFGGTGGIAYRTASEATPRPPSGHVVANR